MLGRQLRSDNDAGPAMNHEAEGESCMADPGGSWRRDALVAFSMDVRDEGVASPKHGLRHRAILSVKLPIHFVAAQRLHFG